MFPNGILGALLCVLAPKSISTKAPINPKAIPEPFNQVIFSLRKIAESTNKITGASVMTTPLFIGVESCNPLKNISILRVIPNTAHRNILPQSLRSTFSLGKNKLVIQNSIAAPRTRSIINPKGPI